MYESDAKFACIVCDAFPETSLWFKVDILVKANPREEEIGTESIVRYYQMVLSIRPAAIMYGLGFSAMERQCPSK